MGNSLVGLGDTQGKKILDIGSGVGNYSLKLCSTAREVVGVDISEKSLERAKQGAMKLGIKNFIPIRSDFKSVEWVEYFDVVLVINVIHHFDELDLLLKNIRKAIKNDGKLVILEFNPLNPLFIPFLIMIKQFRSHFNKFYFRSNPFTLKKRLEKENFKITKISKQGCLPLRLYNYSLAFKSINETLNRIPIVNLLSAFHIFECRKL